MPQDTEINVTLSSGCVYCDLECCSPERHVEKEPIIAEITVTF
jgi:hypothetical protein